MNRIGVAKPSIADTVAFHRDITGAALRRVWLAL